MIPCPFEVTIIYVVDDTNGEKLQFRYEGPSGQRDIVPKLRVLKLPMNFMSFFVGKQDHLFVHSFRLVVAFCPFVLDCFLKNSSIERWWKVQMNSATFAPKLNVVKDISRDPRHGLWDPVFAYFVRNGKLFDLFYWRGWGGGAQVAKSRLIGLRDWRSVEHVLLSRKGQTWTPSCGKKLKDLTIWRP